jgi:hypothetical protein
MPRVNNCTSIILYIDPMEFLSVEMKKVVELHAKTQILVCDYCSEKNPVQFYNACPKHKACNHCHSKPEMICNRRNGICLVKGCSHAVANFPLQPDERLAESNKIHNELTEAMKTAVQIEHEKFRGKEQELSIAKDTATAEKARADQAARDLVEAQRELQEAQEAAAQEAAAQAAAAPPRVTGGKRIRDCETEEEKEELREEKRAKRDLAKERKRKLETFDEIERAGRLVQAKFDAISRVGLTADQISAIRDAEIAFEEAEEDDEDEC